MPNNIPATQERLEPFYMGQFGVDGSDVPLGIKTGMSNVIYVGQPDAAGLIEPLDGNDGTRWNAPKLTVQAGLDACVSGQGDMVCLLPGSYVITEALTMTRDAVRLYAWDWSRAPYSPSVVIQSNTYDHDLLHIDAAQIEIAGIRFANALTATNICIGAANGANAIGLDIHHCRFSYGHAGIHIGAGGTQQDFHVDRCYFLEYNETAGNAGIIFNDAWQGLVEDCFFHTTYTGTYGASFSQNQVYYGVLMRRNDFVIEVENGVAIYRAGNAVTARFHGNRVSGGPTATTAITQRVDGGDCAVDNRVSDGAGGALIDATT